MLLYFGHQFRRRRRILERRAVMREFLSQESTTMSGQFSGWYERQWQQEDQQGGRELDQLLEDLLDIKEQVGNGIFNLLIVWMGICWLPLIVYIWLSPDEEE